MKKCFVFLMAALLMCSLYPLAVADTFNILSAEAHIDGIPPCDRMAIEEDFYIYGYSGCGKTDGSKGSDATWALFEQYVLDLIGTGSFAVAHHDDEDPFERWCLKYTEGELEHPVHMEESLKGDFAVVVVSHKGNVEIWYSRDILTRDLRETAERLGLVEAATPTPKPTPKPTPRPNDGKGNCTACDGDGKCNHCGGDMWYTGWKYVWNSRTREYDNKNVTELCHEDNCYAGSCKTCGGDGWVD